jgi:hypothetical protein
MGVNGWSLEVVRGREVGRVFAITASEAILGNALGGASGIDLATQEGDTPRRMAARQAVVEPHGQGIGLRDLDSPGGTFVNRQRILPGQSRLLLDGDLIQLGGVQLRVVKREATSANVISYRLANGTVCRSWDDFVRVASQRWADVREELESGRLGTWLASIGRTDLAPTSPTSISPDDRLDEWLGRLPTSRPVRPELDVHPARLAIGVTPGGGTTSRTVRVANVGDRLLRIDARIDPIDSTWVSLDDPAPGSPRTVIDGIDLRLNFAIPEHLPRPLIATLVISGNGGSKRVELVLESKGIADAVVVPIGGSHDWFGRVPIGTRFLSLGFAGLLVRLVMGLTNGMFRAEGFSAATGETPGLLGTVVVFAVAAGLAGGWLAARRGGSGQAVFGLISGGIAGGAFAGLAVAASRSIEPFLGRLAGSPIAVGLLWAAIGAGLAGVSMVVAPRKTTEAS